MPHIVNKPELQKRVLEKPNRVGFIGFLVKSGLCKKTQLDEFWDFYGFSVTRMSTIK